METGSFDQKVVVGGRRGRRVGRLGGGGLAYSAHLLVGSCYCFSGKEDSSSMGP